VHVCLLHLSICLPTATSVLTRVLCVSAEQHCQNQQQMASQEGAAAAAAGRPALRVGRTREFRTGTDTELVAIDGPPVSLFVLCGDRLEAAQLFRTGGLSVHMVRMEGHPVSMASCTLGDHQWMLARDALVARLDARVFVFELPGFFYVVVVPPDAERKCGTLAEIFSRFAAYYDLTTADGTDKWLFLILASVQSS
jgi:hypothetical protein